MATISLQSASLRGTGVSPFSAHGLTAFRLHVRGLVAGVRLTAGKDRDAALPGRLPQGNVLACEWQLQSQGELNIGRVVDTQSKV